MTRARGASSASPVTHLDFLCHVAGGWTWPSAPGGCVWVLSSRTEGCRTRGLCGLRVRALPSGLCGGSLHPPLGTRGAFHQASSITAPLMGAPPAGRPPPHPTPLWPCNQSRGAGSLARAGSHRYQLTAWVPFPFTRGRLTMADSPHRGPGPPPRERPWRAIGPHDLAPWRGGPPLPTGRTNGAFSSCQRPGSGRNRPPCQPGRAAASSPPCEPAPPHLGLGFTP